MKFTIPHGIAALVSALAVLLPVLQSVAPAAAPGPMGIAIAGGIGLTLTIGHSVIGAVKANPNVIVKMLPLLLTLPLLATLHGCATFSGWVNSPSAQPVIIAAVDVAVATAEQRGVSAVQINDIAKQALVANQNTSATLATVAAVVNQQLAKLNLPPADLAAAQILEVALAAEIQARIGTNADLAAARAAVSDVLNAVIEASGG